MDDDLRAQIALLQARVEALEAERRQPVDGVAPAPASPEPTSTTERSNRREVLKKAGIGAAAVVGGTLAMARPAAAADGNPLIIGQSNTGTNATFLNTSTFSVSASSATATIDASNFSTGVGVRGSNTAPGAAGVRGVADQGVGVNGRAGTTGAGTGVWGQATSGTGVLGSGALDGAVGVQAGSSSGPALRIMEVGGTVAMPPTSLAWQVGDIVRKGTGLWYCYVSGTGTASKWVKISSALVTLPAPVRVYDSRSGFPPVAIGPKAPLVANAARTIDLKVNSSGVPSAITSVLLSIVATNTVTGTGGFLSVYRNGIAFPGTSNLNWSAGGQTVAVTTVSAVDALSQVALFAGSATDVVVDVIGFSP